MSATAFFTISEITLAQPQPDNPLTVDRQDPLIPTGYGRRELTSFEKYRINQAIAQLDRAAKAELERDNLDRAMELWYRQLRLTRIFDRQAEIETLGEIGEIAWTENRREDVRNIANRLIAIHTEITAEKELDANLLSRFGVAYQQVRYLDKAINIYQQILANSREANNRVAEYNNLETLGRLYLAIFDYDNAANIYQQLLSNNTSAEKEETYLQTLINIYDRTKQTNKSILAKKRLIEQYIDDQKINKTPALEIAIAQDYETLKQTDVASEFYNKALTTASTTKQLALASDALIRLGKLYQEKNDLERAIDTYTKLSDFQQQSDNYYGLVNTYDALGNLYLKLDRKHQAQQYFQQGLDLAKNLNYKVEYFNNRIKLNQI